MVEPIESDKSIKDDANVENRKTNLEKTYAGPKSNHHTDMKSMTLNYLWRELVENHAKTNFDGGRERLSMLENLLQVPTYNNKTDKIEWISPGSLFRQYVTKEMVEYTFEGAGLIIAEPDCKFMVKERKALVARPGDTLKAGYGFRNPREPVAMEMVLVSQAPLKYSGYVYSMKLPKMHNFICQGLLVSDVTK